MKVLLRRDYHRGTGRLAACVALFADAPQSPDREIKIEMSLRLVISLSSLLCYFVLSPAFQALLRSGTESQYPLYPLSSEMFQDMLFEYGPRRGK